MGEIYVFLLSTFGMEASGKSVVISGITLTQE